MKYDELKKVGLGILAIQALCLTPALSFGWGVDVNSTVKTNTNEAARDANRNSFNRYGSDNFGGDKTIGSYNHYGPENSFNVNVSGNAKNIVNGDANMNTGHTFSGNSNSTTSNMSSGAALGSTSGANTSSSVQRDLRMGHAVNGSAAAGVSQRAGNLAGGSYASGDVQGNKLTQSPVQNIGVKSNLSISGITNVVGDFKVSK